MQIIIQKKTNDYNIQTHRGSGKTPTKDKFVSLAILPPLPHHLGEWKCGRVGSGEQFVMCTLEKLLLTQYADSWATLELQL